jgi:hypothetical protein
MDERQITTSTTLTAARSGLVLDVEDALLRAPDNFQDAFDLADEAAW